MAKPTTPAPRTSFARAAPARADGRSLGDFGGLSPAERKLLDRCRNGKVTVIAEERPETETAANRVRAAFVRFLALGGDDVTAVHEHGVRLRGAWLTGALDLDAAKIVFPLVLQDCWIDRIDAYLTDLASLSLDGSRLVGGLWGDGLHCRGNIFMGGGFHATGAVRLVGATIDGDLSCSRGRFENEDGHALRCDLARVSGGIYLRAGFHSKGEVVLLDTTIGGTLLCEGRFENENGAALTCDRAKISGGVYMRTGFEAIGEVRLPGVSIGGNLDCDGGKFRNEMGDALMCHRAEITGGMYLRHGFHATGEVGLLGATIGGDLDCNEAKLENRNGTALVCQGVQVAGAFQFRSVEWIAGNVELSSMHVTDLCDDAGSWMCGEGRLILDGFTYSRLVGAAPTDAVRRIAWLQRQQASHLGDDFRPQPWEQLTAVLRAMGHPDEAKDIAVAKQEHLRRAGRIVRGARTLHRLYGLLVGYGYRPLRLLVATASVWLICFFAYWAATNPTWFGADTRLLAPPDPEPGVVAQVPDYRNFVPLIYSADVLLPVIDLGYKDDWQPVVADSAGHPLIWGQLLRFLYWFEIAFGWVAGLLLVGVLGNLIKKD